MRIGFLLSCVLMVSIMGCGRKTTIVTSKPLIADPTPLLTTAKRHIEQPDVAVATLPEELRHTVLFQFDSDAISESERAALILVADQCQGRPVEIVGGCCPIGSDDYNFRLGLRRAAAVEKVLRGCPNIEIRSVGEDNLVSTIPSQYYLNRRAEITIR